MTYAADQSAPEAVEALALTEHARQRHGDPAAVWDACAEMESVALLTRPGWLIVFEPYGYWATVAEKLAMRSPERVVCFSWNVELDADFSVWESRDLLLRFDAFSPDVRLGSQPDRFVEDMTRAGIGTDPGEGSLLAALFALAEALTGCQIEPDFLYGDLIWGVR